MPTPQEPANRLIKSSYARILVELFREYGEDPHQAIRDSGLPPDLFDLDQEFLPQEPVKRLLYLLGNQLGMTNFGDLVRTAIKQKSLPKLLGQFSECSTVRDALEHSRDVFAYDATNVSVGLETVHGRTWYWCKRENDGSDPFIWSEVWAVLYAIELVRALTKSAGRPNSLKSRLMKSSFTKRSLANRLNTSSVMIVLSG